MKPTERKNTVNKLKYIEIPPINNKKSMWISSHFNSYPLILYRLCTRGKENYMDVESKTEAVKIFL